MVRTRSQPHPRPDSAPKHPEDASEHGEASSETSSDVSPLRRGRGASVSRRSWIIGALFGAGALTAVIGIISAIGNGRPTPEPTPHSPIVPPPPIAPDSATLGPGSETTYSSLPFVSQCADVPWAQTIDPSRQVFRFELRKGDRWSTDIANHDDRRERSEISMRTPLSTQAPTWVAFDVAIYGDLSQMWPGGSTLFHQVFQRPTPGAPGGPPIVAFQVTQDLRLRVTLRGAGRSTSIYGPSTDTVIYDEEWRDEGKVTKYVYRVTPDPRNGSILVWRNGTQLAAKDGVPLGYSNDSGNNSPYAKFGLYRASSPATVVGQFANVRITSSSLFARVGDPEPWPSIGSSSQAPTAAATGH